MASRGEFADRTCVVFGGANQGIGYAFAREALRAHRMRVILCDIDGKRCQDAAKTLTINDTDAAKMIEAVQVDISSNQDMLRLEKTLSGRDVAIVINAAAVFADSAEHDSLAATSLDWELAYRVNVLGAVNVQRLAVNLLSRDKPAHLIQVSSLSAFTGGSGEPYVSSKTALVGLTESLARTLQRNRQQFPKLNVHVVLPGVVNTKFAVSSFRAKRLLTSSPSSSLNETRATTMASTISKDSDQALELMEMMKMVRSHSR